MLEARLHVVVIVLWPRPGERHIVTSRGSDGSSPLPHFGQYGDGFPCKFLRQSLRRRGRRRQGAGCHGTYRQYDPIGLDGDDSVRDLSQRLDIHIGMAIDLYDGRLNCFSVHNQYFIRPTLRQEHARERQHDAEHYEVSKIATPIHDGPPYSARSWPWRVIRLLRSRVDFQRRFLARHSWWMERRQCYQLRLETGGPSGFGVPGANSRRIASVCAPSAGTALRSVMLVRGMARRGS